MNWETPRILCENDVRVAFIIVLRFVITHCVNLHIELHYVILYNIVIIASFNEVDRTWNASIKGKHVNYILLWEKEDCYLFLLFYPIVALPLTRVRNNKTHHFSHYCLSRSGANSPTARLIMVRPDHHKFVTVNISPIGTHRSECRLMGK